MSLPPARHIRRIVFLIAFFAAAAAVGYVATPHGDVPLRTESARSRTQDITIDRHAPPPLRPIPPGPSSHDRGSFAAAGDTAAGASVPSRAEQPVQEGLLASTRADVGGLDAPSVRREMAGGAFSGGGFGHRVRSSRSGTASPGFSSGGMSGGGVWGGATGIGPSQDPQASDVPAETSRSIAALPGPKKPSAPSTGGSSTGSFAAASSNGGGGVSTLAATTPSAATGSSGGSTTSTGGRVTSGATGTAAGDGTLAGRFTGGTSGDTGDPPAIGIAGSGSSPAPTPEPITLLLVGGGLAGAYGARRFFKEKS